MKTIVPSSKIRGKVIGKIRFTLIILLFILKGVSSFSQCGAGYTAAQLNWDFIDFMPSNVANYTTFYLNANVPYNQNFAVGPRKLNFTFSNNANITLNGENGSHTGDALSFSTPGDDVQFTTTTAGVNTVMDFDANVTNVRFSLFDLDNNQVVTITAVNAAAVAQTITVVKANPGSAIVIVGSGTITAIATGPGANIASSSNLATINVTIAGPVKTITLAYSVATGDTWLGDIDACVTGSFPNNYFLGLQPYTGQGTYIIATSDTNTVSLVNVTTGTAKMIFRDASAAKWINGLGYDHNRHEVYYVHDGTATPATNMSLRKYNFDTQVLTTVVADIRTIGIPTFSRGVESAGCTWYDDALYFGIEGNTSASRENVIWRIDFDGSGNPTTTRQVYAKSSSVADWGDFAILDGVLYDFNSGAGSPSYSHLNIMTGQLLANYTGMASTPRQTGLTWDNQLYWVYDSIALYNFNGTIGARTEIVGPTNSDWVGLCGDATGFRPKSDFGDAPNTYDPVALSPALHMEDTALRLGPTFDQEFSKTGGPLANADGADEDAIATVNVLDTATTTYLADVTIYNNTGANVTLIGWLDIDGNGVFEASEGRSLVVPNGGPVLLTRTLSWVGINTPLVTTQWTYLRIRVTRAVSGMTTSDATGFYNSGEVEDYVVWTINTLPVKLVSFDAVPVNNNSVKLTWSSENEALMSGYEIQRSLNSYQWETVTAVSARNQTGTQNYMAWDNSPLQGKSYYRLKILDKNGVYSYSSIKAVTIKVDQFMLVIYPNPVNEQSVVKVISEQYVESMIRVYSANGTELSAKKVMITPGENRIPLDTGRFPGGVYTLRIDTPLDSKTARFIKK